jgi:hypothetical protein
VLEHHGLHHGYDLGFSVVSCGFFVFENGFDAQYTMLFVLANRIWLVCFDTR